MEPDSSNTITLRPFKLTDVDDFFSWASDDQVTKNLRWNSLSSKEEALTFINDKCIPHPWYRSICIYDRSIGLVSVWPGSGDEEGLGHRAVIGYALSAEYWGQGIATKAVRIAVHQVFKDHTDLVRLEAYIDVENKASQRVVEKCGFTNEGLLRNYICLKGKIIDVFIFSFLSTDQIPGEE
ncbi:hypothetical protein ACFE04_029067 [Oxalis oulophora]